MMTEMSFFCVDYPFKGIVHPKIKHYQAIQVVFDFLSSKEPYRRFLAETVVLGDS